jgi:peptidoglycan/LPS O-acetylase OafA/YrhL
MNRPFSIYLDLVRFTAARLVYLWHSNMRPLVNDALPASQYGHSSVIVFFVLSGFVIAYVTDKKGKTWPEPPRPATAEVPLRYSTWQCVWRTGEHMYRRCYQ